MSLKVGYNNSSSGVNLTLYSGFKVFWGVIKARVTRAPTPRPDLSHAHSYFTLAVAAIDNCYALIGAHQPTLFIHRPNSYAIKFRPVDK